jgi:hypothetical protein
MSEKLLHEFVPMTPGVQRADREDPHATPVSLCCHCRLESWSRRAEEECPARLRAEVERLQKALCVYKYVGQEVPPLLFWYRNHRDEVARRHVLPSHIHHGAAPGHEAATWLLHAFDLDRDDDRDFALDRILDIDGVELRAEVKRLGAENAALLRGDRRPVVIHARGDTCVYCDWPFARPWPDDAPTDSAPPFHRPTCPLEALRAALAKVAT